MITFLRVELQSVNSSVPRSNFSESDLDQLANFILEAGGLVKPLLLKSTGFEEYEVIHGHFEYYATVRAREKNLKKGSTVNALIIASENEEAALKQTGILDHKVVVPTNGFEARISNLESRQINMENRFGRIDEVEFEFKKEIQKLNDKFKKFEISVTQTSNPMELLNTLSQHELEEKLQRSRIPAADKKAKLIFEIRQQKPNKRFENYRDIIKSVKSIGETTILTIIDSWSRI